MIFTLTLRIFYASWGEDEPFYCQWRARVQHCWILQGLCRMQSLCQAGEIAGVTDEMPFISSIIHNLLSSWGVKIHDCCWYVQERQRWSGEISQKNNNNNKKCSKFEKSTFVSQYSSSEIPEIWHGRECTLFLWLSALSVAMALCFLH